MKPAFHRAVAGLATLAVVGSLAWGFASAGGPGLRREEQLDERRLDDLQGIVDHLRREYVVHEPDPRLRGPIPTTLDALLAAARTDRPSIRDPQTGELYEFAVLDRSRIRLCARFLRARAEDRDVAWNHPAGRHCFEVDLLER